MFLHLCNMKKSRYSVFWFVALLLLAATGCVQPVEITPPAEREVFVKCILVNDSVQQVTLLYSGGIDEKRFDPVEDADVFIYSPDHGRIPFLPKGNGVWESEFLPKAGKRYSLNVQIPGRNPITATTHFPEAFSVVPKRSAPIRWVADMRTMYEEGTPYYMHLLPNWVNSFYEYVKAAGEWIPKPPACVDFDVLDRIEEYGGTTMQQEMPGMAFRLESKSKVSLYIFGTVTDEQGSVSRLRRMGTNHLNVDRSNLLPEAFHPGIAPEEAIAPLSIVSLQGFPDNQFVKNPQNRQIYDKAILSAYDGQPLFDDYLRIVTGPDYDNGWKLYSIVSEDGSLADSSALVTPPFAIPGDSTFYNQPYYLRFTKDGQRFFSVYGDFYYNIWGENESEAHPSLYFCSVSPEYDQYLQSLRSYLNQQQGDVLTAIYADIRNTASNVEGGYGIFGAACVLRHDCDTRYAPRYYPLRPSDPGYDWYEDYPAYPARLPKL